VTQVTLLAKQIYQSDLSEGRAPQQRKGYAAGTDSVKFADGNAPGVRPRQALRDAALAN
jgi:hypothetical protein